MYPCAPASDRTPQHSPPGRPPPGARGRASPRLPGRPRPQAAADPGLGRARPMPAGQATCRGCRRCEAGSGSPRLGAQADASGAGGRIAIGRRLLLHLLLLLLLRWWRRRWLLGRDQQVGAELRFRARCDSVPHFRAPGVRHQGGTAPPAGCKRARHLTPACRAQTAGEVSCAGGGGGGTGLGGWAKTSLAVLPFPPGLPPQPSSQPRLPLSGQQPELSACCVQDTRINV